MHPNPNSKLSQNFYLYTNSVNVSPKVNQSQILYNSILDSPKSNISNIRKITNMPTLASKSQSIKSVSSRFPVTSYISCSTLQSGVASYSIPRTSRFKDSYKNPYCDNIYNIPDYKSTGVGIGNSARKELWDEKAYIPSTHDYTFNSVFENNLIKKRGYSIVNKHIIKDEKLDFPGPADYEKPVEWSRQSPCTFKFRKNYFYEEDSSKLHDVSPMKYLPEKKLTEATRFKVYGIGIGLGKRTQDQYNVMKNIPGPGDYNLPSMFEKRIQGKHPIN